MERRALIIHMTNSPSGRLAGPKCDYENLRYFLTSNLGGNWYDSEIIPLENPKKQQLKNEILKMADCGYAFVVFSGHGEMEEEEKLQYIELTDGEVSIKELYVKNCKKQTIIIDACRGFFSRRERLLEKSVAFSSNMESLLENISTRNLFDKYLTKAEDGLTVLNAASENQSALDTNLGAAYISSLIAVAEKWEHSSNNSNFSVKDAHEKAVLYIQDHFETKQIPQMNREKRKNHYPFAVKYEYM